MNNIKELNDDINKTEKSLAMSENTATGIIRIVLGNIPIISSINDIHDMVNNQIREYQKEKLQLLFDIINASQRIHDFEVLKSNEVIMQFKKAVTAVLKLEKSDKVFFIGNLFKNEYVEPEVYDADEFNEWLNLIETLSYREILLLKDMYEICKSYRDIKETDTYMELEEIYMQKISSKYGYSKGFISGKLSALVSTGLLYSVEINFPGTTHKVFSITAEMEKFVQKITNGLDYY